MFTAIDECSYHLSATLWCHYNRIVFHCVPRAQNTVSAQERVAEYRNVCDLSLKCQGRGCINATGDARPGGLLDHHLSSLD